MNEETNFFDDHIDLETDSDASKIIENNDNDLNVVTDEPHDEENEATSSEGVLPDEVKKSLVYLLKKGVILHAKKPDMYATISLNQDGLRVYLSNMYLRMVIDDSSGMIFVADQEVDDEDEGGNSSGVVSMINKRTLPLYDTLVLLVIRKYYQEREATGEQTIIIDIEYIESQLIPFLPLTNSSTAARKKLTTVLNKLTEKQVLSIIKGHEERYEITPIIRHIASAEVLEVMLNDYLTLASQASDGELVVKRVETLDEQEAQRSLEQNELTLLEPTTQGNN